MSLKILSKSSSVPATVIFSTLSRTEPAIRSSSLKGISRAPVWFLIHSSPRATSFLTSDSSALFPIVLATLYLPLALWITCTLILPLLLGFLRTNIPKSNKKKPLGHPNQQPEKFRKLKYSNLCEYGTDDCRSQEKGAPMNEAPCR